MGGLKKETESAVKEAMGTAQEGAGKMIRDPGMEARGREKAVSDRTEKKLGEVEKRHEH